MYSTMLWKHHLTRSCKDVAGFSVTSKSNSWMRFNEENKYLFGDLLERPKQKTDRKKLKNENDKKLKAANDINMNTICGQHHSSPSKLENRSCNQLTNIRNDEQLKHNSVLLKESLNTKPLALSVKKFPLLNDTKVNSVYNLKDKSIISLNYSSVNKEEFKSIPSVTKILNVTMPEKARNFLERWKEKMIKKLGVEGFDALNKAKLKQGIDFHDCINQYLIGSPLSDADISQKEMTKLLKSVEGVLENLTDISVVESHVVHSQLPYRGFIDCVAVHNGRPVIIEWKHSAKKKRYLQLTFDAPVQTAAYLGALNYDNNYALPVTSGMVIVAYTDGSPADVFWLSPNLCDRYWKIWLSRLHQYMTL